MVRIRKARATAVTSKQSNGERSAPTTAATAPEQLRVYNPATGDLVAHVSRTPVDEVAHVVARARAAQERWSVQPLRQRTRVLERFHDLVQERAALVMDTLQAESGKARRDALSEVLSVMGTARYYAAHAPHHLRERRARPAVPIVTHAHVVYHPLGVVGLITPWNYPFLLGVGDALPALAAGNAVVTKPSELTPLSCQLAKELLVEAGLDPDLFGIVNGEGADVGQELVRHVDYVGFTGSTAVGRKVALAAAQRLVPYSLELGGKNPMLVLEGARMADAVRGLVSGCFYNSGQTCISVERVYVQESMWDEFVTRAVEETRQLQLGWSTRWDMDMGSLISSAQADAVEAQVRDAVEHGAEVLVGGRRRTDLGAAFYEPTLLAEVEPHMQLHGEETFGPVASLYPVRDAREAIRRANESRYGLNAAVWAGPGERRSREIARELAVGTANVNSTLLVYNSFDVPMGGMGESGLGRRHGAPGIRRYCREQAIVGSVGTLGGYEGILRTMTSERRAKLLIGAIGMLRHIPGVR